MILSDRQIRQALDSGRIVITPRPRDDQFAPSAVDLHVGAEFKRWKEPAPGPLEPLRLSEVNLPDCANLLEEMPADADGCVMVGPKHFVLARTLERVHLPHDSRLAARVEGRSSFARLGLVVHMTAPTIHAGFAGHIVLEMMNFGPFGLRIDPERTLICQIIFEELGDDPECAIHTAFQNQRNVLGKG